MEMDAILFGILRIVIVVSSGVYLAFGYMYANKVVIKEFFNQCDILLAMQKRRAFRTTRAININTILLDNPYSNIEPILRGRELRYYVLTYLECIVFWRTKVNIKEWAKIVLEK